MGIRLLLGGLSENGPRLINIKVLQAKEDVGLFYYLRVVFLEKLLMPNFLLSGVTSCFPNKNIRKYLIVGVKSL